MPARELVVMTGLQGSGRRTPVPPATRRLAAGPCTGAERCVWVDTPLPTCRERNEARQGRARVPPVGLHATASRFVPPSVEEGFDRVDVVRP